MIVHKQEITEVNRNATSIDDFYYRGTEYEDAGGTGIRGLATEFFRDGKLIDRTIILKNNGCTLEIINIFKNRKYYIEFLDNNLHIEALRFFQDRDWQVKSETYEIVDLISVKSMSFGRLLHSFSEMSLEEIHQKISTLVRKNNDE